MNKRVMDVSVIVAEGMQRVGYQVSPETVRTILDQHRIWLQTTAARMGIDIGHLEIAMQLADSVWRNHLWEGIGSRPCDKTQRPEATKVVSGMDIDAHNARNADLLVDLSTVKRALAGTLTREIKGPLGGGYVEWLSQQVIEEVRRLAGEAAGRRPKNYELLEDDGHGIYVRDSHQAGESG